MLAFRKGNRSLKKRYHYQCPTPHGHGEIQLFQTFQKIDDGGPR